MIVVISRLLAALAALGWALCVMTSVTSLAGLVAPAWVRDTLVIAMIPTSLVSIVMLHWSNAGRILTPRRIWQKAFDDSPAWLSYATYGGFLCGVGLFALQLFNVVVPEQTTTMALLSAFYAFALTGLLTASRSAAPSNNPSV